MYLQHFGLTHAPLDKNSPAPLWDDGQQHHRQTRFNWLLDSPALGLMTGESGTGKTAILRQLTNDMNPHQYQLIYQSETDFGRVDIYRGLALALGLEPAFRRAQVWRDIKTHIKHQVEVKRQLPVWIIDEAQNLPSDFFDDFPAFLNHTFDTRNLMTVWLLGTPTLLNTLNKRAHKSINSRIEVRLKLAGIDDPAQYKALIEHAFKTAGCQQALISDCGINLLRQATRGNPRRTAILLKTALRLACEKKQNHLPDEVVELAIEECRE